VVSGVVSGVLSSMACSTRQKVDARPHRPEPSTTKVTAGLSLLVLGLLFVNVLLGDYTVTVPDLLRILSGEVIPGASFLVLQDKLPRAVLGLLVGAALGMAGACSSPCSATRWPAPTSSP
jgi:ABC-type enterobactin transport system permease subunit